MNNRRKGFRRVQIQSLPHEMPGVEACALYCDKGMSCDACHSSVTLLTLEP